MSARRFAPRARLALAAGLLLAVAPAWSADEMAPGFTPPREKIEPPFTNETCLKDCHGVPGFTSGAIGGEQQDLFIAVGDYSASTHGQRGMWCIDCHQGADPNFHPRTGYPHADCRACHSAEPPADVFPPDAQAILKARGIAPPPKEALKGDSWINSAHAKAYLAGKPDAPFCAQCHTAHAVRRSEDPASTVHECNLAATCGACHPGEANRVDVGGVLARFRISGHGKGDLSNRYSASACLSCHQGEAAHGEEETVTGQSCPNCHRPAEKIKAGTADFHLRVTGDESGLSRWLRYGYNALFWGGAAGAALLALFLGFSALYRREDGDD